jgi:hypothetical protein
MEATNGTQPAEVSKIAIWFQPFWAEKPAVSFTQVEGQFALSSISDERMRFKHIISHLDHWYATEVEDIITSPP